MVGALRARARRASPEVRQAVASVLGSVGGPTAVAEIERLLADRSDRVRRAAVFALDAASGATPRELARLRALLDDPAPRVRAAAAVVLGRRRDRASVGALLARLRAPGTWEKPSVAVALGRIGDARAVSELRRLARRPERWLRVCAVHALGEIGAPQGRSTVREALGDPAWSVRGAAATALATLGTARDVPRLVELLDDAHPWPRRGSLVALGRLRWTAAGERIRAALADPSADVRLAACWALGEMGDGSARRTLARFLARCPAPGTAIAAPGPATGSDLPPTGAEDRLFETAVAALARLAAAERDPEVDRALAEAERRVPAAAFARASRTSFLPQTAPGPGPTLRALFEAARAPPPSEGHR